MIKGITDVVLKAMKLSTIRRRKSFVQILETAEGGFGVNGQVFVPRRKIARRLDRLGVKA